MYRGNRVVLLLLIVKYQLCFNKYFYLLLAVHCLPKEVLLEVLHREVRAVAENMVRCC